jgi:hypothetical protein
MSSETAETDHGRQKSSVLICKVDEMMRLVIYR